MPTQNDDQDSERESAQDVMASLLASGALDEMTAKIDAGGVQLTGEGGFLQELVKAVLERGLQTELTSHLGYEKGVPAGRLLPNARSGTSAKTVAGQVGDIDLAIPRDRAGSFVPALVPKESRRIDGLDEMIVSLYANGMTGRGRH